MKKPKLRIKKIRSKIKSEDKERKFVIYETIFFMFNFAVVIGDIQNAKTYLEILRHDLDCLSSLDKKYQERFKQLAVIVDSGISTTRANEIEESKNYYNVKKQSEEYVKKEKELVNIIFESKILNQFFDNDFEIRNIEYSTEYGKVDMVAFDKNVAYPIEVKLKTGRHSIVSQIEKYMRHFWKKLSIKWWKDVKGIVIAQKFEQFALDEFKRLNVVPFVYTIENSMLRLIKL